MNTTPTTDLSNTYEILVPTGGGQALTTLYKNMTNKGVPCELVPVRCKDGVERAGLKLPQAVYDTLLGRN